MKKFIIILIAFIALTSCTKVDDSSSLIKEVVNTASAGTWKITYFFDTDKEETTNFSDYSFIFGSSNSLSASNGSLTHIGNWNVVDDNSNDDSPSDIDFVISFSTPVSFTDLSEDWKIISRTSEKIELTHISGGNGGTDFLTFERN
jgi:hypothetical protein